jgi:hypothetical protein
MEKDPTKSRKVWRGRSHMISDELLDKSMRPGTFKTNHASPRSKVDGCARPNAEYLSGGKVRENDE